MGSQESDSNNSNERTKIAKKGQKSNTLVRTGSWYSLTLDEVQNQLGDLGKPLGSMNLDELLKTVFTVEPDSEIPLGDSCLVTRNSGHHGSSLNRQSSLTLWRDLSNKTVNEVWQSIQEEEGKASIGRNATLGKMTLGDFLVKAGVVAESSSAAKRNTGVLREGVDSVNMMQAQWTSYQVPAMNFVPDHRVQQTYPDAHMTMSSSPLMGNSSDTQMPGRKRVAPGDIVEKSVERRQKRMIKNRESAARSRARKQAYTHELENKVALLEEENERLKRQKEWKKVLPSIPKQPQPKYQLRQTSSAPI